MTNNTNHNWTKTGVEHAICKILIGKERDYIDLDCTEATPSNRRAICRWASEFGHRAELVREKSVRIYKK